jgi:ABC-type multidrug transport system permease subunit
MLRDVRIALSYRIPFFFDVVALLAGAATFYAIGVSIGREDSFFAFVVAGLMVLRVHGSLSRVTQSVEAELESGTFELLVSSPLRPVAAIVSAMAFEVVRGTVLAALLVPVAQLAFGADFVLGTPAAYVALLVGLVGAALLFTAVAAFVVAAVLLIRQGIALANAIALTLPILAGAYFPVDALPQPLELIADVLPFRLAVEVIRTGLIEGRLEGGSALALLAGAGVLLAAAAVVLPYAVERSRRRGSLAHN